MTLKGFKKHCTSSALDKTYDGMLWNGSEENGNVRSWSVKNMKAPTENGDSDGDW